MVLVLVLVLVVRSSKDRPHHTHMGAPCWRHITKAFAF